MKKVEVLLSVMNVKDKQDYERILKNNNITGDVVAINQIPDEYNITNILYGISRIYSYKEKGASKSRNRLLEKADGDICVFADNDTKYVKDYEKIIEQEYIKNPQAEIIIFYVENKNKKREKIKKIGNKKIGFLDVMRIRTCEITIKKDTIKKLQENGIKFDENFGPNANFKKGEETIFISDALKNGIQIYSVNKKIGTVDDTKSTWFTGYNEQYLYNQGAIFFRISSKKYKLLILQYVIRKYFKYRKNVNIIKAYKVMVLGAEDYKQNH